MLIVGIFNSISSSSLPRVTATEIICGDCAGDELLPIRTKLTSDGLCAECGGRNYEFASILGAKLAQHLQNIKEKGKNDARKQQTTIGNSTRHSGASSKKFRVVGR